MVATDERDRKLLTNKKGGGGKSMTSPPSSVAIAPSKSTLARLLEPFKGVDGDEDLPRASLIYGSACAFLLAVAVFFVFSGHILKGAILLMPALGFLGFALYFMRYR